MVFRGQVYRKVMIPLSECAAGERTLLARQVMMNHWPPPDLVALVPQSCDGSGLQGKVLPLTQQWTFLDDAGGSLMDRPGSSTGVVNRMGRVGWNHLIMIFSCPPPSKAKLNWCPPPKWICDFYQLQSDKESEVPTWILIYVGSSSTYLGPKITPLYPSHGKSTMTQRNQWVTTYDTKQIIPPYPRNYGPPLLQKINHGPPYNISSHQPISSNMQPLPKQCVCKAVLGLWMGGQLVVKDIGQKVAMLHACTTRVNISPAAGTPSPCTALL